MTGSQVQIAERERENNKKRKTKKEFLTDELSTLQKTKTCAETNQGQDQSRSSCLHISWHRRAGLCADDVRVEVQESHRLPWGIRKGHALERVIMSKH